MMSDKIVERKLPVGRRKVFIHEPFSEIERVFIKGVRGRSLELLKVDEKTFFERVPFDENGLPTSDVTMLRGTPTMFYAIGLTLYFWPVPANDWVLQVHLNKKVKAA